MKGVCGGFQRIQGDLAGRQERIETNSRFMKMVTFLFCHLLCGILCVILARKRNRSPLHWFAAALPFGVFALFLLLILPAVPEASRSCVLTDRSA